jgi:NAD(P) transhydrogenase subunit alpha
MRIAVPKESARDERRVALTPDGAKELIGKGTKLSVQSQAGAASLCPDEAYAEVGADICPDFATTVGGAEVVLKVLPPTVEEIEALRPGTVLVSFLMPTANSAIIETLCAHQISAFAMDMMPRISRAQSMDAISSMSTIAGYQAAILCADALPMFFPMLMTAAGTLPPARIFVIGAGVSGLQAIATCRRLGAIVEAFDVRPAVKEQIESLGGKFVGMSLLTEEAEDASGYAKEVSGDTHARELELIASRLPHVNAVITTALIPGKPAPTLITNEMVRKMRPGSVIVDIAATNGGNCEATVPGQNIVKDGVTIIGQTDLIGRMACDASRMYSKNISSFLGLMLKDGDLEIDMTDEIIKGTLVTHEGRLVHEIIRLALERGGAA